MDCIVCCLVFITTIGISFGQEHFEIEAVVGYSVELPCNVSAETANDKLTILAWYRNGSSSAFYSRDLRTEEGPGAITSIDGVDGRYRLITTEGEDTEKLEIVRVHPTDSGLYYCFADFATSPGHKTYIQLNVIEPPDRMWVIYENGTRVATATAGSNTSENIGPYYVEDVVHLFCVSFKGKPLPSLTWWREQTMLKDSTTPLSELRLRSDLQYGPLRREDRGLILTCMAQNNDKTTPLTIDVIVDMNLPPELISIRDTSTNAEGSLAPSIGGRVREGQCLNLQCRVLGARPTPTIIWRLNDNTLVNLEQNITVEYTQSLVVSEIELTISQSHDESTVTCCTSANMRGADQYVCAQGLPLTVLYTPVVNINVEHKLENGTLSIIKGSNLVMNCTYQANPAVFRVLWFYENDTISIREGDITPDAFLNNVLVLKNVTEENSGDYACAASNDEGTNYSDIIDVDVLYPTFCTEETRAEYGVEENEFVNLTCSSKGNPEATQYRWVFVNETVSSFMDTLPHSTIENGTDTLTYQRPNGTAFTTIFCWGINGVTSPDLPSIPCTFLITDKIAPRPPTDCIAIKAVSSEITVTCEKGHDGGLLQKFKLIVKLSDTDNELMSITNLEPKFLIEEPKEDSYKLVIIAYNDKGDSSTVEIDKESIIVDETVEELAKSAVTNITTLALSLCGGVALLALAACGLVLCANDRGSRDDLTRAGADPPLCAYNTEESNCETFHDSEDGSDCNVRRTESFRRAMARYPSRNSDVRRTSSFHSARYLNDGPDYDTNKCNDVFRHTNSCRVHSLQNISRRREMDNLCDHLVMRLPPETNYQIPKPMNTFHTMPRKMRHKAAKQIRDDMSEITQASDFSLPPPPDEFGTYRAAARIKDPPTKSIPTYTTIRKPGKETRQPCNDVIISPMNTVGLPTVSGQGSLYTYPDDHHHQVSNPFGEETS